MRRSSLLVLSSSLFAAAILTLGACHTSDTQAQSSGDHVGGAIRDAGGRAVDGVKNGATATGAWVKGVANGVSGGDS